MLETTHKRGTICVLREVGGTGWQALAINPAHYKEWSGCFSIL